MKQCRWRWGDCYKLNVRYLWGLDLFLFFFFSSRRRHTRWSGDWSSDVCSSDLFLNNGMNSMIKAGMLKKESSQRVNFEQSLEGKVVLGTNTFFLWWLDIHYLISLTIFRDNKHRKVTEKIFTTFQRGFGESCTYLDLLEKLWHCPRAIELKGLKWIQSTFKHQV